jgi:transcriptional regulator with XRE-family HTH domain
VKSKSFAGPRLKRLRAEARLTQAEMAAAIGVSAAYLNQMENDRRPVTDRVLGALAERFGLNPRLISDAPEDRIAADLADVLRDPVFQGRGPSLRAVKRSVEVSPELAEQTLTLYEAYQRILDDYRRLADRVAGDDTLRQVEGAHYPYEEVRDFVYFRNNHIAELDEAAEALAAREDFRVGDMLDDLSAYLARTHGIRVTLAPADAAGRPAPMRQYQAERRTLVLSPAIPVNRRAFHLAYQLALREYAGLIDRLVREARFSSPASDAVARVGLANYFAGALLMPYGRFRDTAEALRYDLEALELAFGVSFEQICHRISTLQRPGEEGVPFYFEIGRASCRERV